MTLVKYDPFTGVDSVIRRMDRWMDGFNRRSMVFDNTGWMPKIDVHEEVDRFWISAELPGIVKEDVKVRVNDENMLIISGEKHRIFEEKDGEDNKRLVRSERSYGSFTRSFILPDNVDKESIKAKYENGVLNLEILKKEPEKPSETEIKID